MIGNDRPELERFNIRRLGYLNMIREKKEAEAKEQDKIEEKEVEE